MPEKPKKYFDPISIASRTKQAIHQVQEHNKQAMLAYLIQNSFVQRTVVLCKSKKIADTLGLFLKAETLDVTVIHGNHRSSQCEEVAKAFKANEIKTLITTDKVLETLELDNVERVISFDIPVEYENYNKSLALVDEKGESISLVSELDEANMDVIEMILKVEISVVELEGFIESEAKDTVKVVKDKSKKPRHRSRKSKKDAISEE